MTDVGRHFPWQVAQDFAALAIDAEEPRRGVEATLLKMGEHGVRQSPVGQHRPPYSVADAHHAWGDASAGQWNGAFGHAAMLAEVVGGVMGGLNPELDRVSRSVFNNRVI
jgi:hypothetical protein